MKKLLLILIILSSNLFFAQEKKTTKIEKTTVPVIAVPAKEDSNTEPDEVDLSVVEYLPVFPGCEEAAKNDQSSCFQRMLTNHIVKNTNYTSEMQDNNLQGKVYVLFVINKEGKVDRITAKANNPILEAEAKRVIRLLPQMKPGLYKENPLVLSILFQ